MKFSFLLYFLNIQTEYKVLTASRKASTKVMLFIITTAVSRVASFLKSFECCLRFKGQGNIFACSSKLRTSFPFSLFLIQRGSVAWHIFTSSSMDDIASSIARVFSSSINTRSSSAKEEVPGNITIGIISVQEPKDSENCLEYMFMSKSKEGGTRVEAGCTD